jgi:hypothetical protein
MRGPDPPIHAELVAPSASERKAARGTASSAGSNEKNVAISLPFDLHQERDPARMLFVTASSNTSVRRFLFDFLG